jgi:hypothetical protein
MTFWGQDGEVTSCSSATTPFTTADSGLNGPASRQHSATEWLWSGHSPPPPQGTDHQNPRVHVALEGPSLLDASVTTVRHWFEQISLVGYIDSLQLNWQPGHEGSAHIILGSRLIDDLPPSGPSASAGYVQTCIAQVVRSQEVSVQAWADNQLPPLPPTAGTIATSAADVAVSPMQYQRTGPAGYAPAHRQLKPTRSAAALVPHHRIEPSRPHMSSSLSIESDARESTRPWRPPGLTPLQATETFTFVVKKLSKRVPTSDAAIVSLFSGFGTVVRVEQLVNRGGGRDKALGYAFVDLLATREAALAALTSLNGFRCPERGIKGPLKVEFETGKSAAPETPLDCPPPNRIIPALGGAFPLSIRHEISGEQARRARERLYPRLEPLASHRRVGASSHFADPHFTAPISKGSLIRSASLGAMHRTHRTSNSLERTSSFAAHVWPIDLSVDEDYDSADEDD